MPIYVYECPRCRVTTEQIRNVADREKLPDCPECHHLMPQKIAAPAPQFPGAASWRAK
jgi:putative FmdB family regulatory protein